MLLDFPNWFAGTATIVALVGLGIFIYPWLLRRKGGGTAVGTITLLLTFVFYAFDRSSSVPIATSAVLAALWATAPVVVGIIVWRLQGGAKPQESFKQEVVSDAAPRTSSVGARAP